MKRLNDAEKTAFLVAMFRQSNVPDCIARARLVYQTHREALSCLRYARRTKDRQNVRDAERIAGCYRARWRRCRQDFIVFTSTKTGGAAQ